MARIDTASVLDAVGPLRARDDIDAVFASCTNLRTLSALETLRAQAGPPVWSSNLVLAADMVGRTRAPLDLLAS